MTRLCKCRSLPGEFPRSGKRVSRNSRIRPRKLARSTGNLELRRNHVSRRGFSCSYRYHTHTSLIKVVRRAIRLTGSLDETSTLIDPYLRSRKKAWLALALFCALLCMQCCVWNTWGPIANSVSLAFPSWNQSLVALLSNWGCISYLICCVPCCWLLYNKGLLINAIILNVNNIIICDYYIIY